MDTTLDRSRRYALVMTHHGHEHADRLHLTSVVRYAVATGQTGTECPECAYPNRARRGAFVSHSTGDRHVDLTQTAGCPVCLGLLVLPAFGVPAEQPQGFASIESEQRVHFVVSPIRGTRPLSFVRGGGCSSAR